MLKQQPKSPRRQPRALSPQHTIRTRSASKVPRKTPTRRVTTRRRQSTLKPSSLTASLSTTASTSHSSSTPTDLSQFSHLTIPAAFETDEQKGNFLWLRNKLRPVTVQTLEYFLTQYDIIPLRDTTGPSPISTESAIFQGLLNHQLLVPLDAPPHPYNPETSPLNKQKLLKEVIQMCVELEIIPVHFDQKYKPGTVAPIPYSGGHHTDSRDTTKYATDLTHTMTTLDTINLCLNSSGYYDVPQSPEFIKFPPPGENCLTDFSRNVIKFFKPDNKEDEFTPLRKQLAKVQSEVDQAQGPEVLDEYMRDYHRNDITQQYIATYGGKIPNFEIYKAFLFQQVAQTLLTEHYLYQPNQHILHHTIAQHATHLKEHRAEFEQLQDRHNHEVFLTVQDALPNNAYPVMDLIGKALPMPPDDFVGGDRDISRDALKPLPRMHLSALLTQFQMTPEQTLLSTRYTDEDRREEEAFLDEPQVNQFTQLFQHPQPISTLRHIFLKQFRHDLTIFHNMVSNSVLQKFKTDLDDALWTVDQKKRIGDIICDLHFQNVLDNQFKEAYTKFRMDKFRKENVSPEILMEMNTNPELQESIANLAQEEPIYRHILADKYPAFAQKCFALLLKECDEQIETNQKQMVANDIAKVLGGDVMIH